MTRLVVSVHDVAPATADQTARWCADLDGLGVPASLLVIPGRWRGQQLADVPDFARTVAARAATGDEVVLHGLTHVAGPDGSRARRAVAEVVARGAAEFAALPAAEAGHRIREGRAQLRAAGLDAQGFCPPGWLASPGTVRALRTERMTYLTVHRGVLDLRTGTRHGGFALSHRPGGLGERVGATVMRQWANRTARKRRPLVRIALHPDDLARPGLRDATLRTIEDVLRAGAEPVTYAALLEQP